MFDAFCKSSFLPRISNAPACWWPTEVVVGAFFRCTSLNSIAFVLQRIPVRGDTGFLRFLVISLTQWFSTFFMQRPVLYTNNSSVQLIESYDNSQDSSCIQISHSYNLQTQHILRSQSYSCVTKRNTALITTNANDGVFPKTYYPQ